MTNMVLMIGALVLVLFTGEAYSYPVDDEELDLNIAPSRHMNITGDDVMEVRAIVAKAREIADNKELDRNVMNDVRAVFIGNSQMHGRKRINALQFMHDHADADTKEKIRKVTRHYIHFFQLLAKLSLKNARYAEDLETMKAVFKPVLKNGDTCDIPHEFEKLIALLNDLIYTEGDVRASDRNHYFRAKADYRDFIHRMNVIFIEEITN